MGEKYRMQWTAWNNSCWHASGAGYGLKVPAKDRDKYIERSWKEIELQLPGKAESIRMNIAKTSFWSNECRELISSEIGRWLIENDLAPWAKGSPPKLNVRHEVGSLFVVEDVFWK